MSKHAIYPIPANDRRRNRGVSKTEKVAHFYSHNKDNTIHATPVWYKYENNQIIIGTPDKSCKATNVQWNKKVTTLVDRVEAPTRGVTPSYVDEVNGIFSLVNAFL